jgi:hypothetical protein
VLATPRAADRRRSGVEVGDINRTCTPPPGWGVRVAWAYANARARAPGERAGARAARARQRRRSAPAPLPPPPPRHSGFPQCRGAGRAGRAGEMATPEGVLRATAPECGASVGVRTPPPPSHALPPRLYKRRCTPPNRHCVATPKNNSADTSSVWVCFLGFLDTLR